MKRTLLLVTCSNFIGPPYLAGDCRRDRRNRGQKFGARKGLVRSALGWVVVGVAIAPAAAAAPPPTELLSFLRPHGRTAARAGRGAAPPPGQISWCPHACTSGRGRPTTARPRPRTDANGRMTCSLFFVALGKCPPPLELRNPI